MRALLLVTLLAATGTARADDLFCEGTAYTKSGNAEATRLFELDRPRLRATVGTFAGPASGTIKEGAELYTGYLTTSNGTAYWFNLNRFTGRFILMSKPDENGIGQMEFIGECHRRERRF